MWEFALMAVVSVLFVVDPLGAVPTYLVMTQNATPDQRRATAKRAALVATLVLVVFAAAGNAILRIFGLTMPAFQIAGGLILFLVALDMLRAQRPTQEEAGEIAEATKKEDIAITPLGIPMLAGPAALSTVATLMSRAESALEAVLVLGAIGLTGLVSYLTLRLAEPIHQALGRAGIHVLSRVLGLVLASIAVQFVLEGWTAAHPISSTPTTAAPRPADNSASIRGAETLPRERTASETALQALFGPQIHVSLPRGTPLDPVPHAARHAPVLRFLLPSPLVGPSHGGVVLAPPLSATATRSLRHTKISEVQSPPGNRIS
jgi:multiple antibiotic resistance protein